jgi:hypothetical protein
VTRKSLFVLSQSSGTSLATKTTLRERIRGAQKLAGDMMKGALLTGLDNLFPQTSPIVQQCVGWVKVGPGPAPYTNGTIASEAHDCELRSRCPRFIGERS